MKQISFLLVLILILFSSCSKEIPDCSLQDNLYDTYTYSEDLDQCVLSSTKQRNECGNGVKEETETTCNCPEDVNSNLPIAEGGCSGSKGEFLEYYCEETTKTCELEVTDKVRQDSSLLSLRDGANLAFEVEVKYYTPFMVDRHNIDANILLKNKLDSEGTKIKDIKIRKAYVVTQGKDLLGSVDVNKDFNTEFEDIDVLVPANSFTLDTFDKEMTNVFFKLLVTYKKETYSSGELIRTEDVSVELQDIFENKLEMIDPSNKNEDLSNTGGWG